MQGVFLTSLDSSEDASMASHADTAQAEQFVRQDAASLHAMSDEELQSYIVRCAEECNAAHNRYKSSGNFADAGDRDRWWSAEAEALRERGSRPHVVARLEKERGLA